METLILTIVIFALIMGGMAIGAIFRGKPIKGSCGGMSALGMDTACDVCGGDPKKCDSEDEQAGPEQPSQSEEEKKRARDELFKEA